MILWIALAILLVIAILTMVAIFRNTNKSQSEQSSSNNVVSNFTQKLSMFYKEEINSDYSYKFAYRYESLDEALRNINDNVSVLRTRIEGWENSKKESLELGMKTDVCDRSIARNTKELNEKLQELNKLRRLKEQRTLIKQGKDISDAILDNLLRDLKYRPRGSVFLHTNVLLYTEYEWGYNQVLNAIQPYKSTCDQVINVLFNDIKANADMMQRDYPLLYETIKSTYVEYIDNKADALYYAGMIFMMVCDSCVDPSLLGIISFDSAVRLKKQYHKEMALAIANKPSMA